MMIKNKLKSQDGAAVFFFVLVMTITGLTMAMNTAKLSLDDLEISYAREIGEEVRVSAEGCLENTLQLIRQDTNYGVGAGPIQLSLEEENCTIEVIDLGDDKRKITSTVLVYNYNKLAYEKTIYAVITLYNNIITLDSWSETDPLIIN